VNMEGEREKYQDGENTENRRCGGAAYKDCLGAWPTKTPVGEWPIETPIERTRSHWCSGVHNKGSSLCPTLAICWSASVFTELKGAVGVHHAVYLLTVFPGTRQISCYPGCPMMTGCLVSNDVGNMDVTHCRLQLPRPAMLMLALKWREWIDAHTLTHTHILSLSRSLSLSLTHTHPLTHTGNSHTLATQVYVCMGMYCSC